MRDDGIILYGIQDNMGTRSRSPFSSSTLLNLITEQLNSHIYTFYGCVAKHSSQQGNDLLFKKLPITKSTSHVVRQLGRVVRELG